MATMQEQLDRALAEAETAAAAVRARADLEALKARLALLGLESRVVKFDQGGQVFFRVRLGPYPRGEELNRTRNRLLEAGLDAVVVKQP